MGILPDISHAVRFFVRCHNTFPRIAQHVGNASIRSVAGAGSTLQVTMVQHNPSLSLADSGVCDHSYSHCAVLCGGAWTLAMAVVARSAFIVVLVSLVGLVLWCTPLPSE